MKQQLQQNVHIEISIFDTTCFPFKDLNILFRLFVSHRNFIFILIRYIAITWTILSRLAYKMHFGERTIKVDLV